ncbi:M15 family metallopeptidase [Sphingomonas qomolangmaensis]|uniref:M15 family metallopeptidase n=1 Tax=Sphingomonas qomolangmaensis TaxID=2918765 RepID=A0ABY5L6Y4_9SPHN|nr:M15 family metallopeptidase [Sphingomonas qomolangmaensis]UUL82723.1 M15 family metallopeptidase [Sphingomonas qomolangmaensis]
MRTVLGVTLALTLAACAAPPAEVAAPAPPPPVAAPTVAIAPPPIVARAPVALCERGSVAPTRDGRLLNHFPYPGVSESVLLPAPPPLDDGGACRVHPAMLGDLNRLIAASNADPAVAGKLRSVSCHRGVAFQAQTFCAGILSGRSMGFRDRAWASAPPGYSEHATGYVVDFGTTDRGGCPDADACFAATPVGKWLIANAARYGFEMSFPAGNKQQMKWEPWHWRWVGTSAAVPGATAARATFSQARKSFPARPRPE